LRPPRTETDLVDHQKPKRDDGDHRKLTRDLVDHRRLKPGHVGRRRLKRTRDDVVLLKGKACELWEVSGRRPTAKPHSIG